MPAATRPFHHLLVALDGSVCAADALTEAIGLATCTGAGLTLLHVVEPLAYVDGFESAMHALGDARPLMRQAGEQLLEQASAQALAAGVTCVAELWMPTEGQGRAGRQRLWSIVDAEALAHGCDLIVIGSHGRHGASRALLGSDAEQIVRHARLPVLVVKARAQEDAKG